jgi:hypothetical protein
MGMEGRKALIRSKLWTTTIALLTALAGCATPPAVWVHSEHTDPARFERDRAQCVYEANAATASTPSSIYLPQAVGQDVATGIRQGELASLCMEARGYTRPGGATQASALPAGVAPNVVPAQTAPARPGGPYSLRQQVQKLAVEAHCATDPQPFGSGAYGGVTILSVQCQDGKTLEFRCSVDTCTALK